MPNTGPAAASHRGLEGRLRSSAPALGGPWLNQGGLERDGLANGVTNTQCKTPAHQGFNTPRPPALETVC